MCKSSNANVDNYPAQWFPIDTRIEKTAELRLISDKNTITNDPLEVGLRAKHDAKDGWE